MEACKAREHGSDSKQNNQVEGSIMQAKEWTRAFGRCNPVEHVITKQQACMECAGENWSQVEQQATQAGRLHSHLSPLVVSFSRYVTHPVPCSCS
jgi:hypothetical protein